MFTSSQLSKIRLVLIQAFHHMDSPVYLTTAQIYAQIERLCTIIGEHRFGGTKILRNLMSHYVKYLLNWRDYRNKTLSFRDMGTSLLQI